VEKQANGVGETLQGEPLNSHQEQSNESILWSMLVEQHLQWASQPPDGAKAKYDDKNAV
jgi:hypothetical protein